MAKQIRSRVAGKTYSLNMYSVISVYCIAGVATYRGPNVALFKKLWPVLNSGEQKKDHQKNLEEMAKKYELMALNKKVWRPLLYSV